MKTYRVEFKVRGAQDDVQIVRAINREMAIASAKLQSYAARFFVSLTVNEI